MAKKKEQAAGGGQEEGKSGKELKIMSVQVVTPESVTRNPRQMSLLYIIDKLGPTHEKTLHHLVSMIQEELRVDLGYEFKKVGSTPYSTQLKSDVVALLYVGFIEAEPGLYRKLRATSTGKDALERATPPAGLVDALKSNFEMLRNKTSILDGELDLEIRKRVGGLAGRRRSYF